VIGRNPLELVVTASGGDKGRLNREDFVRIDATGAAASEGQPKSSAETMLHVVLAELPATGAVLHTHSVWGTLLSDTHFPDQGFWIEDYEMLKGLEGIRTHESRLWVPIFDNTQDIPVLADEVQQCLASHPEEISHGFLIRNHGLYTWGNDIASARRHVEIFEFLFEVIGRKTDFSR
jgi:methylthioribulose-1-phosphate dehydratase